jgi:hypothetical protein
MGCCQVAAVECVFSGQEEGECEEGVQGCEFEEVEDRVCCYAWIICIRCFVYLFGVVASHHVPSRARVHSLLMGMLASVG